jgi:hypothetical protein
MRRYTTAKSSSLSYSGRSGRTATALLAAVVVEAVVVIGRKLAVRAICWRVWEGKARLNREVVRGYAVHGVLEGRGAAL